MCEWLIKDYQTMCYNLQNKITPYKVREHELVKKMKEIKKEFDCDDLTAWGVLKTRLESQLAEKTKAERNV